MTKNQQPSKNVQAAPTAGPREAQAKQPDANNGKRAAQGRPAPARHRNWLLIGVVIGMLVLIGIAIAWLRPVPQSVTAPPEADPALGPSTAPVTIVEYGDFGCPTCRAWHQAGILNQIRAQYGDKVRFVWRDFPVITPESPKAAEAGRCAADQGKFWQYHDYLYEQAQGLSVSALKTYAAALKLDTRAFNQCLDSGQYSGTVDRNLQDASAHGFRGTPSFLVNGQPVAGSQSFSFFQRLIDTALGSK